MALSKLGLYIKMYDIRNSDNLYDESFVRGISTQKEFIETKADLSGVSLTSYKVVPPDAFAYVSDTSRRGDKISLAHNVSQQNYLVSSISTVFFVKENSGLLSDYLFMYFNRSEFDRYARFNSWGSARETFDWDTLCNIEIELPSLEIQQKYVNVYKAMVANQKVYEKGLDDLKLVCDAYIENLRREYPCEKIGDYIEEVNNRNNLLLINNVQGVNSSSNFGKTKTDTTGLDFSKYKIVQKGQFAYNPSRINLGSIALLNDDDCIVSPMYIVFQSIDGKKLLPEYLMLWFGRTEFQRSTLFYAIGSVRDTFNFNLMQDVEIPIPNINIQKAIANIYSVYIKRKEINEQLKIRVKNICSILIQGALQEGRKEES